MSTLKGIKHQTLWIQYKDSSIPSIRLMEYLANKGDLMNDEEIKENGLDPEKIDGPDFLGVIKTKKGPIIIRMEDPNTKY